MPIIRANRVENPLPHLKYGLPPSNQEAIQQGFIHLCGIDSYKAGAECDYHFHDSDEYWFILEGTAHVIVGDEEGDLEYGDVVYTPPSTYHQFKAITDATVLWVHGKPQGKMREGHLHKEDE